MTITAQQIAEMVGGTVEGNGDVAIHAPAKIEEATAGTITFFANPKYEPHLYTTQASAVLVPADYELRQPIAATLIRVQEVYDTVRQLLEQFGAMAEAQGQNQGSRHLQSAIADDAQVSPSASVGAFAVIESGAVVADGAQIGAQVYVGAGVQVGVDTVLHPGVKVYAGCKIGARCVIHANVVIGSDGFGFVPQEDGSLKKMPQLGIVEIGNDVEVGANTVIDRATMGATRVGEGVKLDNLIQIAHNVEVGKHTAIAAQTGIAGSAKIGENCMISGQVAIVGHITVADRTKIQGQSGIGRSIKKPDTAWHGSPAIEYGKFMRSQVIFKQLPELADRVRSLEKALKKLSEGE